MMKDANKNEVPGWFVYDGQGCLDIEATLAAAPAEWEADVSAFGRVPEWFDVCPPEEIDALIREFEAMPADERDKYAPEQIARVSENLKLMSAYHAVYRREGLSASRKALVRSICYWLSVKTMNEIPLPRQEKG